MTDAGWTKGSPADAGFYWFRANAKDASPWVVKVQKIGMGMMQLWRIGSDRPVTIGDGGEFLGPISPDTYHQGRVAGELFGLRQGLLIAYIFESGTAKQVIEGIKSRIAEIEQQTQGGKP